MDESTKHINNLCEYYESLVDENGRELLIEGIPLSEFTNKAVIGIIYSLAKKIEHDKSFYLRSLELLSK